MSTLAKKPVTAEELLKLPSDGYRYELSRGKLRKMPPAGEAHGDFAMRLGWRLAQLVETKALGVVYAAETGFKLQENPDTVRAPDVAFVSRERLEQQPPAKGYRQGPPDLAVEVVSPNDRPAEVAEKVYEWLHYGVEEVWILDPEGRSLTVFRAGEVLWTLGETDILTSPLFPDWSLPLGELFT